METFEAHDRRECRKLKVARGFSFWNYKKTKWIRRGAPTKIRKFRKLFSIGLLLKKFYSEFQFWAAASTHPPTP